MIVSNGVAIHSSFLAWKILWTEDPGGLQFTGSQKARHDLVTKHIDTGWESQRDKFLLGGSSNSFFTFVLMSLPTMSILL